jgi:Cu-Zn family superoxide dismutase
MKIKGILTMMLALAFAASYAFADEAVVQINLLDEKGVGKDIGSVKAVDGEYGLLLTPDLSGLTPGLHGFHVHEKPDCSHVMKDGKHVVGLAAGGHYDPGKTGKHEGPYGKGHLGDLPALYVDSNGKAAHTVLAPRLKVKDLKGRSLMIHAGGDNYSDAPAPLGGGGGRAACGVVK